MLLRPTALHHLHPLHLRLQVLLLLPIALLPLPIRLRLLLLILLELLTLPVAMFVFVLVLIAPFLHSSCAITLNQRTPAVRNRLYQNTCAVPSCEDFFDDL